MWDRQVTRGEAQGWAADKILVNCLNGARTIDCCWGKRHARERQLRWEVIQTRLKNAQLAIEVDPTLPAHQAELATATELLNLLDSQHAAWVDQVLQA